MLPGPAGPGCCLVSFHFLWAILAMQPLCTEWCKNIPARFREHLGEYCAIVCVLRLTAEHFEVDYRNLAVIFFPSHSVISTETISDTCVIKFALYWRHEIHTTFFGHFRMKKNYSASSKFDSYIGCAIRLLAVGASSRNLGIKRLPNLVEVALPYRLYYQADVNGLKSVKFNQHSASQKKHLFKIVASEASHVAPKATDFHCGTFILRICAYILTILYSKTEKYPQGWSKVCFQGSCVFYCSCCAGRQKVRTQLDICDSQKPWKGPVRIRISHKHCWDLAIPV